MSAYIEFDKYFLHLPPLSREDDFNLFWNNALIDIKGVPIEPKFDIDVKNCTENFEVNTLIFKSFLKTPTHATLYRPRKTTNPKIIIYIHDYYRPVPISEQNLDKETAFLFLYLRGHHLLNNLNDNQDETTDALPAFITENILDTDNYYMKGIYLDIISAIKCLRLDRKIDCSAIGIIGKGLGSAPAIFAACYSDRIKGLFLDSPGFSYLELGQNISHSEYASEINDYISHSRKNKNQIKKNLTYFDTINFADKISCPVLMSVGLKNTLLRPECSFALFNHLQCEKTAEIFPMDGYDAGGSKMFRKGVKWLKKIINAV